MPGEPIAITGISCRFPGEISTPRSFWEFVLNGGDAIRPVPDERKSLWKPWPDDGDFPERGGFVDGIDRFDAAFFNISPREARHIDPQQRILLELAWEALEDARIPPARLEGQSVGVYMGIFLAEYWDLQRYAAPSSVGMHTNTGGTLSIAANRLSYFLDLKGPSIAVDTACSSSLTAVHLACRDLQAGTCTAALAGGANLLLTPQTTRGFQQAQMLSPDGRCRAFDRGANGYGRSDGAGIVVLKRLSDAVNDGDAVYAVIHGSAINQDGRSRGLTVPGQNAQQSVIKAAAREGGVDAQRLAFVEAHGTGTPTGDPVEAQAIGRATGNGRATGDGRTTGVGRATGDVGCLIGSVKTNIGHTEAAAGVAGLIKAALSLKHGVLPPSLHFEEPNPDIPFEELGLKVATEPVVIPGPAFAGVNSFGFGGANAHVVLGSPPDTKSARNAAGSSTASDPAAGVKGGAGGAEVSNGADGPRDKADHRSVSDQHTPQLLVLSAHSTAALRQRASDTASLLQSRPDSPPADLAATLSLHRSHLDHRLALVFDRAKEAARNLEAFSGGGIPDRFETARSGPQPAPIVFVFTGMGPQWFGMGQALYRVDGVFREALDAFDQRFTAVSGRSIRDAMWNGSEGERITDVDIAQPANMALQWALAAWWQSLGVCPEYIIGHSVGEIAGACVAGAITLEEGVRIIYQRSRLQKAFQGRGEMLAAGLSREKAQETIEPYGDGLSVAAVNSPVSVTISGETSDIDRLQMEIGERRLFCRKLHTEIAYHSGQMEGIRGEFTTALSGLSPSKARVPLLSTVTGVRANGTDLDADHWWRNIRSPVLFDQTFEQILDGVAPLFIQIGPHPVLSSSIYENLAHLNRTGHAVASLRRDRGARDVLLEAVAKCYVHGHEIRWDRLVDPPRTRVPLPSYPWQRERYWLDGTTNQQGGQGGQGGPRGLYPNPLIGLGIESSVEAGTRIWEREISLDIHPILTDHTVLDRSIMPLTGQIEMLFETLDESEIPVAFTDLELLHPLLLPETGSHLVQVVLRQNGYTLSSKPESQDSDSSWLAHMKAERSRVAGKAERIDLEAVKSRCDRRITSRRFYECATELGFQYGPAFRPVDEIVYSDREALVSLTSMDEGHEPYRLHPGVLDAGLQALLLLVPDDEQHLPVGVKTVVLQRLPERHETLVAYAKLRETSEDSGLLADVYLVDEEGFPVVALEGMTLSRASGTGNRRSVANNPHGLYREEWVADYNWEEDPQPGPVSHWFVLSDDPRLGSKLADALSRPGVKSEFIDISGSESGKNRGTLAKKMGSVECETGSCVGLTGTWTGGGNGQSGQRFCPHTGPALESFELVRTVLDNPDQPCRLRLITAGAQSVTEGDKASPALASIWGCGRVVLREHPELNCTLIDLPAGIDGIDVKRLASIVGSDTSPVEIALRETDVFTRRLVPFDLERCETKTVPVTSYTKTSYVLSQSTPGSIDDLHFVTKPESGPGPDEVVIRVRAAALNFRDVLTALGMLKAPSRRSPSFGWECVGEVVALGDRVETVEIGDVVMGMMSGAMAGHVTAKAGLVVRKPDHLGIEEAATLPVAFLTAYLGLVVRGGISSGDRVLVHNATGGVGLAALQIAQQAKAEVFATAGSPEKRTLLKEMGISHVMDSRSLDFSEEIMDKTDGKGMDIILNTLSGPGMQASLSVLAPHGRFIEIGKTDALNHGSIDLDRFDQNRSYHPIDLAQFIEDRPDRAGAMLRKIVDMAAGGKIQPLPYEAYPMLKAPDAFRFMAQARHTGKLVLVDDGTPVPVVLGDDDPVIRPGGTYLVTGGAGGVGRYLTGWLLDRGAGLVVITGRREIEDTELATDPSGNVRYVQADVTDRDEIERLMTDLRAERGPVRGVFHAAGVLDDGILLTQTVERIRQVLEPKTTGAWILHELTRALELDLFVLFSSAASLAGTAGQASYAAANAFLDGLADLRRQEGLPVTTINWSPWEDTGMATDERAIDRLRRQGLRSIPPDEAGALLDQVLRRDLHRIGVIPTAEPAGESLLAPFLPPDDRPELAPQSIPPLSKADLNALPDDRLRVYIEDYVNDAISRIVEVDPENVDPGQTWRSLGVDSLMAVELRNRIEAGLHVSIPVETLQSETEIGWTIEKLLEGLKVESRL